MPRLFYPLLALLATTAKSTSLQLSLSPSSALPDLSSLPPSTHATLSGSPGNRSSLPLRTDNTFLFPDLQPGEWLLDIHTLDYIFPSLRVDVADHNTASVLPVRVAGDGGPAPTQEPETISVYLTHPSNKWSHLGSKIAVSTAPLSSDDTVKVAVSAVAKRLFYEHKTGFDLLGFFKNPMILMGVVSMGLVFGMPYLMENMDEETKAEFAEIQKQGPLGGAGGSGAAQQIQNFDLAGWMAGKSDSSSSSSSPAAAAAAAAAAAKK